MSFPLPLSVSVLDTPDGPGRITPAKRNSKKLTGRHKNFEHDGDPTKLGGRINNRRAGISPECALRLILETK
jgi:hypothetical protein